VRDEGKEGILFTENKGKGRARSEQKKDPLEGTILARGEERGYLSLFINKGDKAGVVFLRGGGSPGGEGRRPKG